MGMDNGKKREIFLRGRQEYPKVCAQATSNLWKCLKRQWGDSGSELHAIPDATAKKVTI